MTYEELHRALAEVAEGDLEELVRSMCKPREPRPKHRVQYRPVPASRSESVITSSIEWVAG